MAGAGPGGDPRTVQVSRTLLVAGAAALGVCLVAIAFLLGRESGRRVGPTHGAPAVNAGPPDAPMAAPLGELAPPVVGGGDREDVARYFAQLEAIEARAKTWSDPAALAQKLLSQVVDGDAGGFDGLITAQRAARRDLQSLVPPEACRAHLERTLALLDEATALLEGVRDRVLGGDVEGLAGFAVQAQSLEARAREVDTLAAGIKKRYGL